MAEFTTNLDVVNHEILITRTFDAPRDLVWKAWTDPKHLIHWWGPNGFTATIHEMDVRTGGVCRFILHGPDGRDYHNKIVYVDVVKPEKIAYRHAGEKEHEAVGFQVTVLFVAEGDTTTLTMRMTFASAEELKRVNDQYGAIEGAKQNIDRLAAYLTKIQ